MPTNQNSIDLPDCHESVQSRERRIAFLIPSFGDGGSNRFMMKVAKGLSDMGYSVDLIAINPTGQYRQSDFGDVRIIELGKIPIKGMTVINAIFSLARYIRREKPYSIMSATTAVNILLLAAKGLSRTTIELPIDGGTKIIISERNAVKASAVDAGGLSRIYRKMIPFMYPKADAIVSVSEGLAKELVDDFEIPSSKVKVIYNPVLSDELVDQSQLPLEYDWFNDDVPVLLSVGRLHSQKDFPTLIRAFAVLRKRREARLLILGEGDCRDELQVLINTLGISESVRMPGFADNPYVYMSRADLFVMTSIYEGICNVVIEAIACGCPVVATDCPGGGPYEILEGGKWGALLPVGDVEGITSAMLSSLDNPISSDELRQRASYFSYDIGMSNYRTLIWGDDEGV